MRKHLQEGDSLILPHLKNLTTVAMVLPYDVGLRGVALFNGLPALESIHCFNVLSLADYDGPHVVMRKSHATSLSFVRNCLNCPMLADYLQCFVDLEHFTYEHQDFDDDYDPFDSFLLRSGLLMGSRLTLQSLTIYSISGDRDFIGSLQGFEVLRELTTDWTLLDPSDLNPSRTLESPLQLFPNALQTLHLVHCGVCNDDGCTGRLLGLFRGVVKAKAKGELLKLKSIVMHSEFVTGFCCQTQAVISDLYRICDGSGIALTLTWDDILRRPYTGFKRDESDEEDEQDEQNYQDNWVKAR